MGGTNVQVTITIFSDFQCPYCRTVAADLAEIRRAHASDGRVAVIYRHYPLQFHKTAHLAAMAAECAGLQGRFEAYHDQLFAHQDSLNYAQWSSYARNANVANIARFETCLRDGRVAAVITRDSIAGDRLGVRGTPTLLVNNQKLVGSPGREALQGYVAAALRKATNKED